MIFSDALTKQLNALTSAMDDPGTDLQTILDVLVDDLSAVVSSFLGLTMTLKIDEVPVTLTAIDTDSALAACTSLELPLASSGGGDGTVVFYAQHPGAFVDLAEDVQRFPGLHGLVVLDGHLSSRLDPPRSAGITGLANLSAVNRAVGVLITRGHTPNGAHAELRRTAAHNLSSVHAAAHHVLNSMPPRPTTSDTGIP